MSGDRTMQDQTLKKHLTDLLEWGAAHLAIEPVLRGFPAAHAGTQAGAIRHTPWEILEHMRLAQRDVMDVLQTQGHVSPAWPEGFWPSTRSPQDSAEWTGSVERFLDELAAVRALVSSHETNLYAASPRGSGGTVLREILFLADHNVYHLGQLIVLRQAFGE